MALDLSSLQKAVNSLTRAVNVANKMIEGEIDTDKEEVVRAGVIQNFEFTYKLCWKFMKRWLEQNAGSEIMDALTRKELFRIAAEHLLIKDVEIWFAYQKARNETSHIYNEQTAQNVYVVANNFAVQANELLKTLEAKND